MPASIGGGPSAEGESSLNMDTSTNQPDLHQINLEHPLRVLTPRQVAMVDDVLAEIGEFGEVRLILHRNRLRFIQKLQSMDALG